jgi:hypothetical protein
MYEFEGTGGVVYWTLEPVATPDFTRIPAVSKI